MNENQHQYMYAQQMYPYYYPPTSHAYYPTEQTRQVPEEQQTAQTGMLPMEQSYIENILRLNRGKHVSVYMTFENNNKWNAKIFKGVIEAAGRDHIILSDPESGKRYLLLMVYLDYITFDEEINYEYPFDNTSASNQFSTYPPR